MIRVTAFILLLLVSYSSLSQDSYVLDQLVGYKIVASETIVGFYDSNGKAYTTFIGCDYGRTILFADNTKLTCNDYLFIGEEYQPSAVILYNGVNIKMVVGSNIFDMRS